MKTICKHAYPPDLCGTCNPPAKEKRNARRSAAACCASLRDNAACCAKSAKNARQTHYTFRNKDGQTIQLRGDLTMEDLIRMGYTDIRLVMPESPMKPHVWRADPMHNAEVWDGDPKAPPETAHKSMKLKQNTEAGKTAQAQQVNSSLNYSSHVNNS